MLSSDHQAIHVPSLRRPIVALVLAILAPTAVVALQIGAATVIAGGDAYVNTDGWVSIVFSTLELCVIACLVAISATAAVRHLTARPRGHRWLSWVAILLDATTVAAVFVPSAIALAALLTT